MLVVPTKSVGSTESAEPTEVAEPTETPEEEPEPTEAPEPTQESKPAEDRYVSQEDVDRFEELRDAAQQSNSIFGPATGTMVEGVGTVQGIFPEVVTSNSYFRATFTNPDDLSVTYDAGFGIRHVEGNNQLRLVIGTDDRWAMRVGDGAAYQTGEAHGFQSEPGEQNTIEVVANGDTGYLAINGTVVAVLDLSPSNAAGDIWVAAGLDPADILSGRSSTVSDFTIWSLP